MEYSALELKAKEYATEAHGSINHRRRYTDEPYITHPAAVVELVRSVPHNDNMLAASWLHDVWEDTGRPLADIQYTFGHTVASLVWWLSDMSRPEDGNRAARKAIDRDHIAAAPVEAKTIKLADMIDNARAIEKYDPAFAEVYMGEKWEALKVLKGGDKTLWYIARDIVISSKAALKHLLVHPRTRELIWV